jgi:hypothetical protein
VSLPSDFWLAATAVCTLALAIATVWLALEGRAQLLELRRQHADELRLRREEELRTWAVELRKLLGTLRNTVIDSERTMSDFDPWQAKLAAISSQSQSREERMRLGLGADWQPLVNAVAAYTDLVGFVDAGLRRKFATMLTDVEDAAANADPVSLAIHAQAFVSVIDAVIVLIDEHLGIKTAMRTERRARDDLMQ